MQRPPSNNIFIEQLIEFLRFLKSLWGVLAGISVFFPLSNVLTQVIPLNKAICLECGGLWNIPTPIATAVTTLSALFIILYTFEQRFTFNDKQRRPRIRQQALLSFIFGILTLLVYLVVYTLLVHRFFPDHWGWGINTRTPGKDLRWYITDAVLLLCYTIFFTLMTRAFELLAMLEYFRGDS